MQRETSPALLARGNRAGGINSIPRSEAAPPRRTRSPGTPPSAISRQHLGDEIAHHHGIGTDLVQRLARYAALDLGGGLMPMPLDRVGGG
jgi:hypothetical protein